MADKKHDTKIKRPIVDSKTFTVYGIPQPQGSTRAFSIRGKTIITSANKNLRPWRQQVSDSMYAQCGPYRGNGKEGIGVGVVFFFEKPKSARNRTLMTVKPDIDKLARAILDAGTGIVYKDDAQVFTITCTKVYDSPARAVITVYTHG